MQNKGVIRLFAIVFSLICIYELSFTVVSNRVAADAAEYANGDAEREQNYLDSMLTQPVIDLGTESLTWTYAEVKEEEINLGLDLKGGMNLILEVSVRDILLELADGTDDPTFRRALANADEASTNTDRAYAEVFFEELDKLIAEEGNNRLYKNPAFFGTRKMSELLGSLDATNEEYKNYILGEVDKAVEQVYIVLKARIDQFGVVQPNLQRLEGTGRILVELPGVKNPDRIKTGITPTAELKFWGAFKGYEVIPYMDQVNTALRDIVDNPNAVEEAEGNDEVVDAIEDQAEEVVDNDDFNVDDFMGEELEGDSAVASADTTAADSAAIAAEQAFNPLYDIFLPNWRQNANQQLQFVPGPVVGFVKPQDTALLMDYLRIPQVEALRGSQLRYAKFVFGRPDANNGYLAMYALQSDRDGNAPMDGEVVTDARPDFENGNSVVTLAMNGRGSVQWAELTRTLSQQPDQFDTQEFNPGGENPGRRGYIAITLDDVVYSAPGVDEEIAGGRTSIRGQFTPEEADDLSTVLRTGKLPVPTRIVQSDVIGPTLGAEAISASLNSFMIAFLVVMIYMILYYSFAGIAADISLLVNMLFIFGVLASAGVVLTLPGMAGIVLTIGMAVDANVIIYERIREELANGKDTRLAIRDGYKFSYSAIIDANITTLLTAIALAIFGTGPIRGFATTLIIGIFSSVFTAIFITRLVFEWRLRKTQNIPFSTGFSKGILQKANFNFINRRKVAYIISGLLIAVSIGSLATKSLNLGVDFLGGRSYTVRFDQPVEVTGIASSLSEHFVNEDGESFTPIVKTLGEPSQVVITTEYRYAQSGADVDMLIQQELYEGVKEFYANEIDFETFLNPDNNTGIVQSRQVGATIADDIERAAVWAVFFSLLVIFVYILVRFNKPQYSFGAIAAIIHDVIIVFGIFSIFDGILPFQLEVDQAFVAAILTVIGYSLNDTVVVFDRVREYYSHYHKKRSLESILNSAMNGTLSRTLNTSMTTLVVLLIILIFGGESIRGFIFAITVGVLVGTYSSLFVATPIVYDTTKDKGEDNK